MSTIERRFFSGELRAEETAGKRYLRGRAASYDVMSHDLGGWREVLKQGCFDSALAARDLDVIHNINHSPDKILGRTTSGTLKLTSDSKGLNYRTWLPETGYADDLAELCARGDVNSSSFAFTVDRDGETWSDIDDPDNAGARCGLRTITAIARLYDVSTVSNAAYPETAAELASRSLPGSMPLELRNRLKLRSAADDVDDDCSCDCPACQDGDCQDCSNEQCDDPNCRCEYSMRGAGGNGSPTKTVDGEALHADCFVIVGDPKDPETWHLPWKFAAEGETENHLRDALARFDQVKGLSEAEKEAAWEKLVHLCKGHGIDVAGEDDDDGAARERSRRLALATAEW